MTYHIKYQGSLGYMVIPSVKIRKWLYIEQERQVKSNVNNRPHESDRTRRAHIISGDRISELESKRENWINYSV